jgi:hypothetical protein
MPICPRCDTASLGGEVHQCTGPRSYLGAPVAAGVGAMCGAISGYLLLYPLSRWGIVDTKIGASLMPVYLIIFLGAVIRAIGGAMQLDKNVTMSRARPSENLWQFVRVDHHRFSCELHFNGES